MCTNNYMVLTYTILSNYSEICTSVQTAFALLNNSCTCPLVGGILIYVKIVLDIRQVQQYIFEYKYSCFYISDNHTRCYHIDIMDSQYHTAADLVAEWICTIVCTTIIIRRPGLGLDVYICTYRCRYFVYICTYICRQKSDICTYRCRFFLYILFVELQFSL